MGFSKVFKSLVDVSGNLISVEFIRFSRLVKSSEFLRRRVDISGNPRLIGPSKFPKL